MKTSCLIIAASMATASAFVPAANKAPQSTRLNVATKGKTRPFRKALSKLDKENFSTTLAEVEPFLTTEAGMSIYKKSMKRIAVRASALGVEVPSDYAKDAKCTKKRREKQDEYCKAKSEEAAAAAAEAAEAEAQGAEEEAVAEEEAAVEEEEPALVEA